MLYYRSRIYVEMNTPSFFCDCLGAKTRKCFLSFQENNFAGNQEMFSNPSGSEVPVWEGRVPLGSKISELSDGKIIQEELSVGRNISYELSDRQNYQRRREIIWKLGRIKLFGVWVLSTTCCFWIMALVALKRKCCWKIVWETECGLDKSTRIFEFPFSVENLFPPSLHPWRTVTLSSSAAAQILLQIPITDSHADPAGQLFPVFWKYIGHFAHTWQNSLFLVKNFQCIYDVSPNFLFFVNPSILRSLEFQDSS